MANFNFLWQRTVSLLMWPWLVKMVVRWRLIRWSWYHQVHFPESTEKKQTTTPTGVPCAREEWNLKKTVFYKCLENQDWMSTVWIPIVCMMYPIPTYIFNWLYIFQPCALRHSLTYIHPSMVGMIYPVPTYIFNWHHPIPINTMNIFNWYIFF